MKLFKAAAVLILFCLISIVSYAQEKVYFAHFTNTDENVYFDSKDRLVMSYQIEGPSTAKEIEDLNRLFGYFNMFEKVEFTPTSEQNIWDVYEITYPGIKIINHKKLFATAGIYTVFVDGEPYPVDGFSMKMLKN